MTKGLEGGVEKEKGKQRKEKEEGIREELSRGSIIVYRRVPRRVYNQRDEMKEALAISCLFC